MANVTNEWHIGQRVIHLQAQLPFTFITEEQIKYRKCNIKIYVAQRCNRIHPVCAPSAASPTSGVANLVEFFISECWLFACTLSVSMLWRCWQLTKFLIYVCRLLSTPWNSWKVLNHIGISLNFLWQVLPVVLKHVDYTGSKLHRVMGSDTFCGTCHSALVFNHIYSGFWTQLIGAKIKRK